MSDEDSVRAKQSVLPRKIIIGFSFTKRKREKAQQTSSIVKNKIDLYDFELEWSEYIGKLRLNVPQFSFIHSLFLDVLDFNGQLMKVLINYRIVMRRDLTQFKTTMISHQHSLKRMTKRNFWTDFGVHRKFPSFN